MARITSLVPLLALLAATPALAQNTAVAFGGLQQDTSLPVEVTADALQVAQSDGTATFEGNVLVSQGDMRLSAGKLRVVYGDGAGEIREMLATGGVTLASGTEAAEAREAVYSIANGTVVMTGDVILTQGRNALSSQKLTIDLKTGTGALEGQVKTIFQTGNASPGGN